MNNTLEDKRKEIFGSWYPILKDELSSPYMSNIRNYINSEMARGVTIYPEPSDFFKAYSLTPFREVKVIILGNEPYPSELSNGLAFGSKRWETPELKNIWNELEDDIAFGLYLEGDYSLEKWASQGVFLINIVLTVQKNRPNAHKGIGWEKFVGNTLLKLVQDPAPKVFMLWGDGPQSMFDKVIEKHTTLDIPHLVLEAPYPKKDFEVKDIFGRINPNYPKTFRGCKHFSIANEFLRKNNRAAIIW